MEQQAHKDLPVETFPVEAQGEPELSSQAQRILEASQRFEISDGETLETGIDMIKQVHDHKKKVEKTRKDLTEPILASKKNIDQRFKAITVPLEKAERLLRDKVTEYQQLEEAKKREAQAALRKAEEEARQKAEEDERKDSPPPKDNVTLQPDNSVMTQQSAEKIVGNTGATGSFRKVWKHRVVDKAALFAKHPELLLPDDKSIGQLVRSGVRDLPGIEIYQEDELVVR